MIKAIIFDFGQTLVDSAGGFRSAEKEAQNRIFSDLRLPSWDKFLSEYRKIRKAFHQSSRFSRKKIWETVYIHFEHEPDTNCLELWESEYWKRIRTGSGKHLRSTQWDLSNWPWRSSRLCAIALMAAL